MQLAEIVNTCTHESVAEAAIASIGPGFARDIARAAAARDMSVGALVAGQVRRFSWRAGDADRHKLARAISGAPAPVLAGLKHILEETMFDEHHSAGPRNRAACDQSPTRTAA